MTSAIETAVLSAKNTITGSKIEFSTIPLEFMNANFWFENPKYDLKVGFLVRWIYETIEVEVGGSKKPWKICTSLCVKKGDLRNSIKRARKLSDEQTDALVADCYELLKQYYISYYMLDRFQLAFHIYEVEEQRFRSLPQEAEPNDLLASQAILVL